MSSGDGRIFKDEFNRAQVESVTEEARKAEMGLQLITDVQKEQERPPTRMERKFKRIFAASGRSTQVFTTGFMMGAMVGGAFGSVMGLYTAYQYRSPLMVPMVMLSSGVSFGCFMGLGMMIRTQDG